MSNKKVNKAGSVLTLLLGMAIIIYAQPWKLFRSDPPPPPSATAVDPFDRTDILSTEFKAADAGGRLVSLNDTDKYTDLMLYIDRTRYDYSSLLYLLLQGDLRAIMPLYKLHAWYGMCREGLDPFYVEHLPRENVHGKPTEECKRNVTEMAAFWKKWTIKIWGEADFYREEAKIYKTEARSERIQKLLDASLRKAMDLGDPEAWYYYAEWKVDENAPSDPLKNPYVLKALELGSPAALHDVGEMLIQSDNKAECQRGLQYLERSINRDNTHALYDFLMLYTLGGRCLQRDSEKAFYYALLQALALEKPLPAPEALTDDGLRLVYTQAMHPVQGENSFPPMESLREADDMLRSALASYMFFGYSMNKELSDEDRKAARGMYAKHLAAARTAYENIPLSPSRQHFLEAQERLKQSIPALKAEITAEHAWIKWSLLPTEVFDAARREALIQAGKPADAEGAESY